MGITGKLTGSSVFVPLDPLKFCLEFPCLSVHPKSKKHWIKWSVKSLVLELFGLAAKNWCALFTVNFIALACLQILLLLIINWSNCWLHCKFHAISYVIHFIRGMATEYPKFCFFSLKLEKGPTVKLRALLLFLFNELETFWFLAYFNFLSVLTSGLESLHLTDYWRWQVIL